MEDLLALDPFDRLLDSLDQQGAARLTLPGLEEPARPAEYVRMILNGARDEGWTFERAWSAAINRLQPSQAGGFVEDGLAATLREERALIEEGRPFYQAYYEGREPQPRERAEAVTAAWSRLDGPVTSSGRRSRRRAA